MMVHSEAQHQHDSFMRARLKEARRRTVKYDRPDRLEAHAAASALVLLHDSDCSCQICTRRGETGRLAA